MDDADCVCEQPRPIITNEGPDKKVEDAAEKYGLIIIIRFSYVPSFKFASIRCKMQVKPDETESVYLYATQRSTVETELINNWFNGNNYRTSEATAIALSGRPEVTLANG